MSSSETRSEDVILFVYGSLLRGESNHHVIASARYVGDAVTEPRFELLDLGPYPALVESGATAVRGELFEVGPRLLAQLDLFEDVPEIYRRTEVGLQGGGRAQAYLLQPRHAHGRARVVSGDWRNR